MAALQQEQWQFEITPRSPAKSDFGTRIVITDLHNDVLRRLDDGLFLSQLRDRLARTYSFFIGRVVKFTLNDAEINKESFEIGSNYASEKFTRGTSVMHRHGRYCLSYRRRIPG
jgi:hypothetical protein